MATIEETVAAANAAAKPTGDKVTFTPGATPGTAAITVGEVKYSVTGSPAFVSAVRIASESPGDIYLRLAAALAAENSKLKALYQATPLVARPGAMKQNVNNQYGNRPVIRVMTKEVDVVSDQTLNGALVVGSFDAWILNEVQESDSEKIDVVETFGAPHLFVSGRFIRKYTFSGMVRATPVNAHAGSDSGSNNTEDSARQLRTTQFDLLRVFYDEYLRATEQAARGTYTEIIVDGQSYIGYIGTMNFHRNADGEQMVPFTFTMYGIDRASSGDSDAQAMLAPFNKKKRKPRGVSDPVAYANMAVAAGNVELSISAPGTLNLGKVSPEKPNGEVTSAQALVTLTATGSPMNLRVTGLRGARLVYKKSVTSGEAIPVDNTPVPLGTSEIGVEVTNYFQLYQDLVGMAPSSKPVEVSREVTIKAACGSTAKVVVKATMQGQAAVVLASLSAVLNGVATTGMLESLTSDLPSTLVLGEATNTDAITDLNTIPVELKATFAFPDNTPVEAEMLSAAEVGVNAVRYGPTVGLFGAESVTAGDKTPFAESQDPVVERSVGSTRPATMSIRFTLKSLIDPAAQKLNAAGYSPFRFADHMEFATQLAIKIKGLSPLTTPWIKFAVKVPSAKGYAMFKMMQIGPMSPVTQTANGGQYVAMRIVLTKIETRKELVDDAIMAALLAMTLWIRMPGANKGGQQLSIALNGPGPQAIKGSSQFVSMGSFGATTTISTESIALTVTPKLIQNGETVTIQIAFETTGALKPLEQTSFNNFVAGLRNPSRIEMRAPQDSIILGAWPYPTPGDA